MEIPFVCHPQQKAILHYTEPVPSLYGISGLLFEDVKESHFLGTKCLAGTLDLAMIHISKNS